MGYNDWSGARVIDYREHRLRQPPRGYEWREANGDTPIRITRSQRRELDEAFKDLDPEWVKQHTLFPDAEVVDDDDE